MSVLNQILHKKLVAILRGLEAKDTQAVAEALLEGGINIIEVTLNSPNALSAIEALSKNMGDKIIVGAGTVLDSNAARQAIHAGAKFIISPITDPGTIHITKELGAVSIPGAYTPTEIVMGHKNGADIIKVFPAMSPAYIKNIRGPLNDIPIMATGGITLENIAEFMKAGTTAVGIGSNLVPNKPVNAGYLKELTIKASQYVKAILT
jgi:2-dehydro-3-deoxyphosphogluconate aldolase/(4S)-4-hydroxy-2-oxoglutarate aldolase